MGLNNLKIAIKWCHDGELADWEAQLKPLEKELNDELGGPEL